MSHIKLPDTDENILSGDSLLDERWGLVKVKEVFYRCSIENPFDDISDKEDRRIHSLNKIERKRIIADRLRSIKVTFEKIGEEKDLVPTPTQIEDTLKKVDNTIEDIRRECKDKDMNWHEIYNFLMSIRDSVQKLQESEEKKKEKRREMLNDLL